jgi:hypothetical protein
MVMTIYIDAVDATDTTTLELTNVQNSSAKIEVFIIVKYSTDFFEVF